MGIRMGNPAWGIAHGVLPWGIRIAHIFYPSEGPAEDRASQGPKLSKLRNFRWTIADGVQPSKDNWENDIGELEVNGSLVEWIGEVIFYE